LAKFVFRSINYGYKTGQLSNTQKLGFITCIPKGDKPRKFMKNWRPVSPLKLFQKNLKNSLVKPSDPGLFSFFILFILAVYSA
jgi:hypothetical protein